MEVEDRKTKAERGRASFLKQIGQWKTIQSMITIFQLNYLLIDLALFISQSFKLDLENHIFEALLTVFNLEVALLLDYKADRCNNYATYFLSGIFILSNLFLRFVTGLNYHVMTFTVNWIIQIIMIKEFAIRQRCYVIAAYAIYFCIFANLDGLMVFDIRWVMVFPLLICLGLFFKFFKEIYEGLILKHAFKMPRHLFTLAMLKITDFGVFLATCLPLYSAFISKQLSSLAATACIWHFLTYICHVLFQERQVFYHYGKRVVIYRLSQNQFASKFEFVPFKQGKGPWGRQICSKCCKSQARVLFKRCGHFLLCKRCLIDLYKKGWDRCLICDKKYYVCLQISRSFAEMSQPETISTESEGHNLYLVSDSTSIAIIQDSDSQRPIRAQQQFFKRFLSD